MKICFIFQRRFTPTEHKIAELLKKQGRADSFCGYVYLKSSYEFLLHQQDIKYSALLHDEEIHNKYLTEELDLNFLKDLEEKYVHNLWQCVSVDRVIMHGLGIREYPHDKPLYKHEDIMKIVQVKARAIISMLEKERPDCIFIPAIGSIANALFYHIGKTKNIKVIVGAETRISQGYILSNDYKNFSWAQEKFEKIKRGEYSSKKNDDAKKFLHEFRKKPSTYLYVMKNYANVDNRTKELLDLFSKKLIRSIFWYFKLSYRYAQTKKDNNYLSESPVGFLIDRVRRKIRSLIGFKDLYDKIDAQDNYVYYPLHLEPEIATLLLAPFWTDQINLIRQIAKSVPLPYKIYVKEHPAMVGYRPRAFYKKLKNIPNVKIINPNENSFGLIKNSKLVATITGTAGWEAAMTGKPVITFGDIYFNALSFVKKCEKIEILPSLVNDQIFRFRYDENELVNFIAALMEESADIGLHEIWEKGVSKDKEEESLLRFSDLLYDKIKK